MCLLLASFEARSSYSAALGPMSNLFATRLAFEGAFDLLDSAKNPPALVRTTHGATELLGLECFAVSVLDLMASVFFAWTSEDTKPCPGICCSSLWRRLFFTTLHTSFPGGNPGLGWVRFRLGGSGWVHSGFQLTWRAMGKEGAQAPTFGLGMAESETWAFLAFWHQKEVRFGRPFEPQR